MASRTYKTPQFPHLKGSNSIPDFPLPQPEDTQTNVAPTAGKGGSIPHKTRQYSDKQRKQ